MNNNKGDVVNVVSSVVMWALAALIGIVVFTTIADLVIGFASTGIGAVILAVIAIVWWKKYKENK